MSYSTSNPPVKVAGGLGSGPTVWQYSSTNIHTDVDAAGFFTNGGDLGMKVGDTVFVLDTGTPTTTIHQVTAVSSGAATVSSATLS